MGEAIGAHALAVDGCGIPVFATPLWRLAQAFARFASLDHIDDGDAEALRVVRESIIAEPFQLAGTGRFDAALPLATEGRVVGKIGADGIHADAAIELGMGTALKVRDGGARAVAPAAIAILTAIGALDEVAFGRLRTFAEPHVRAADGRPVGRLAVTLPTRRSGGERKTSLEGGGHWYKGVSVLVDVGADGVRGLPSDSPTSSNSIRRFTCAN